MGRMCNLCGQRFPLQLGIALSACSTKHYVTIYGLSKKNKDTTFYDL